MSLKNNQPYLDPKYFCERMIAFALPPRVLIGVSGGRDSMLLARLCADHSSNLGTEFIAVTVDHGLREESAQEAAQVAKWCASIGLQHETLVWRADKPVSAVQERARDARYGLLCRTANRLNAEAILTAHTLDDQAETVLMRLTRGAGPAGLSAMDEVRLIAADAGPPVRLIRPLLPVSRREVTEKISVLDQPYLDDPSNEDDKYERVRTRALLSALAEQNILTPHALAQTARKSALLVKEQRRQASLMFDRCSGVFERWGGARLNVKKVLEDARDSADLTERIGVFTRLLFAVGGAKYAPAEEDVSRLFDNLRTARQATLAGCLVRHDGLNLLVMREPAGFAGRGGKKPDHICVLGPGAKTLWDQRMIIENCSPDKEIELRPVNSTHIVPTDVLNRSRDAILTLPWVSMSGVDSRDNGFLGSVLSRGVLEISVRSILQERFTGEIHRFVTVKGQGRMEN